MSQKFLTPIDLTKQELQNAVIQNLGTAPNSPVAGQVYYDSGTAHFMGYVGTWSRLDNFTAAEILALLLPIDGSGSGLDADTLDNHDTPYFLARGNHTGTQLASTISDFDTQVRTNRLDQLTAPTAAVSFNSQRITNVATPTSGTDAANKNYVDASITGLKWKDSVRVASTANVTVSSAPSSIDGVTLSANDRVLLKNQTSGSENGIYVFNGTASALTRAVDADTAAEILQAAVLVQEGSTNADTGWQCTTNAPITLGTTSLAFVQFTGSGTYVAGTGLTLTSNTFAIDSAYVGQTSITTLGTITTGTWTGTAIAVANGGTGATTAANARTNLGLGTIATQASSNVTITGGSITGITDLAVADGGTGASTASAARSNLGATGKYSATIGDGSTTAIAVTQGTHGLATNGQMVAAVFDASTGAQVWCDISINNSNGTVTFTFSSAPASNAYRIVIVG
jgi:hypothetical protein